jgi:hypothetical protein
MYKLKLTTKEGVSYPNDLQNLSKSEAKEQLNLLSEKTLNDTFEVDVQGWDVICLRYPDDSYEIYEIIDQDED